MSIPPRTLILIAALVLAAGGCAEETCADAQDCAGCLEIEGCNWDEGECVVQCAPDSICYGPSLAAAAPTCPAAKSCADGTDCESCLAIDKCNWTGGQCLEQCLQDVTCFGPGNSAAPTCP